MSFEEMVVALFAIVGGLAFTGYVFGKITNLIKAWVNRNSSEVPAEEFNRLAKAFVKFKKDSERRIQNLEAIIAGDEEAPAASVEEKAPPAGEDAANAQGSSKRIHVEEPSPSKKDSNDGNLRNMLRE